MTIISGEMLKLLRSISPRAKISDIREDKGKIRGKRYKGNW